MPNQSTHAYGWRGPDLPDQRDYHLLDLGSPAAMPQSVDLRPLCPPVLDQLSIGSCTAQAISSAIQFTRAKEGLTPDFTPSRLFIYWNERAMEGTPPNVDSGASIRDGIKSVAKLGVCDETLWPYDIAQFATKPADVDYQAALGCRVTQYLRLTQNLYRMRGCLAAGYPFVFGFTVYESFESADVAATGMVPMPSAGESVVGGHAVLCCGYDNASKKFIVRNSWSSAWGQAGYCLFDYSYLTRADLASDFWTIRVTS